MRNGRRFPSFRTTALVVVGGLVAVTAVAAGARAAGGCAPYSTLECTALARSGTWTPNWGTGTDAGGLVDGAGQGTGLTLTVPSSKGGAYLPAKLSVVRAAAALDLTATPGLQYRVTGGNNLDDALAVGLRADAAPTSVAVSLVNPSAGTDKSEQAGLFYGPTEDDYVKLVMIASGVGKSRPQLVREVGGVSRGKTTDPTTNDQIDGPARTTYATSTVRLTLQADPVALRVTGTYSVNGGAATTLGSFSVPKSFFDGTKLQQNAATAGSTTFAGLMASTRNNPAPITYRFTGLTTTGPAADTTPPAAPTAITGSYASGAAQVGWTASTSTDVAGYRVYRATTSPVTTSSTPVSGTGLVTATSFADSSGAAGTSYKYAVAAVDTSGNVSALSTEATIAFPSVDTTPPAAPTGLTATYTAGWVRLAWTPPADPDVAGYRVYRSTTGTVATTGAAYSGTALLTGTTFSDNQALSNTTYTYRVVAVDTSGNASTGSAPASATTPLTPYSLDVNFSDAATTPPAGYVRDYGQPYGDRSGPEQGSGLTYGWFNLATGAPLDLTRNGRVRTGTADLRLRSFMHMQYTGTATAGTATPGGWEAALPTGVYTVSVAVGDPGYTNSTHWLNIEGQNAVAAFTPSTTTQWATATRTVWVSDGRLTITPSGGTNTKIDYVTIDRVEGGESRPRLQGISPDNLAVNVPTDASVTSEVLLTGGGIDTATVTSSNITLTRVADGVTVPADVNTSGGGDVVVLTPSAPMTVATLYRIDVTAGLKDVSGNAFLPWSSVFTVGASTAGGGIAGVAFTAGPNAGQGLFTSLTVGPDRKLYAGTLTGEIWSFPINADGTLGAGTSNTAVKVAEGGPRTIIGLAFDPASTVDNPILWVTSNVQYVGSPTVPDWTGHILKLTGPTLSTVTTVVVGLPRSARDHETNSIAFGPDGALYFSQGSNTAMGAADSAWGNRDERILNAAILRLDLAKLPATLPLDAKTVDGGGSYDPYAANAPLTIYASGVRNAYDLVWHSNGNLYAPTNGSAAGGNVPATPAVLPDSCANRIDKGTSGVWTGPATPAVTGNPVAETDYIFTIRQGGYYGHPNPTRCEWVLNNGNPTGGSDPFETAAYPVGTAADRNYRLADTFDAGLHASANGTIEYKESTFGGKLKGMLLVVRYSAGKDVMVVDVSGTNGRPVSKVTGIAGLTGFSDPLDIAQDPVTGAVYVSELGGNRIAVRLPAA